MLTLTGNNMYVGGTTISGGTLNINADAALVQCQPRRRRTLRSTAGLLQAAAARGAPQAADRNIMVKSGAPRTFDTHGQYDGDMMSCSMAAVAVA